jgi:hypothetical protein
VRFGFACSAGHEIIEEFRVGQAPTTVRCDEHDRYAIRVFDAPNICEDRRHMAAPKPGEPQPGWSWALGAPLPTSRSEMRAIEKSRGIEFVTPAEARADAQRLREGKSLDEAPKLPKGYLAKAIAARGIRFDRSVSAPRVLTREESERKLAAERPDWKPAEAKTAAPEKMPG